MSKEVTVRLDASDATVAIEKHKALVDFAFVELAGYVRNLMGNTNHTVMILKEIQNARKALKGN